MTPQSKAAAAREAIIEGYQDAIEGRTVAFDGNLRRLLAKTEKGTEELPPSEEEG